MKTFSIAMIAQVVVTGCLAFQTAAPWKATRVARAASKLSMMADKSQSLPFMPRPAALDGSMAGDVGFDPLGFSNWIPISFLREAEIKHGRISMLAVVGWIVADIYHLPGDVHNVSSLEAHDAAVKWGAMSQLLLWIGFLECFGAVAVVQMLQGSGRKPGEFGFDPLNFSKTEKAAKEYELKEIKNGRLAMLAFSGIVTQAALTGKSFPFI